MGEQSRDGNQHTGDDGRAVGILTISTKGARGERDDASGRRLEELVAEAGLTVAVRAVVPDDAATISAALRSWADERRLALIVTTGGTGLGPYDVTPEATLAVLERQAAGISEALRAGTLARTPMAMLSRGVAGTRGRTLIVNLPGSPRAVAECFDVLRPVLGHALDILRETVTDHGAAAGPGGTP
jgi:molybdenum cofactor synthesis domain-containing protein